MTSKADVYSIDSIQVLSGLEAVRRRPGMYVGDVRDGSGLHHMLWELVANARDEHLAGRAKRVRVSIEGQLAEIEDDGGGMDPSPHPTLGVSRIEVALTQLCSGTGYALPMVNALSETFEIEVRRDGWSWHQRFARGVPSGPLERGTRERRTGTRIRFCADSSIFSATPFDREAIRCRLVELAALNPKLTFELMAERICEPSGIIKLLESLAVRDITDTFVMTSRQDDVLVEVALGWGTEPFTRVRSFVKQNEMLDGGTHESGFWKGMIAAVRAQPACADRVKRRVSFARRQLEGLRAIVNVDLPHPRFGGATRSRLANREVECIVRARVEEAYSAHLREHPELVRRLASRAC